MSCSDYPILGGTDQLPTGTSTPSRGRVTAIDSIKTFTADSGAEGKFHPLPALAEQGFPNIAKLPASIRIVLESFLRNVDDREITEEDVKSLANYNPQSPREYEISFTVTRIVLQDFTGGRFSSISPPCAMPQLPAVPIP